MTIQLKRHHSARIRNNRKHYWGRCNKSPRMLGILRKTPKPCSCIMCRNKRSYEGETSQELRFKLTERINEIKAEIPVGYKEIKSGILRDSDLVYHINIDEWKHPNQSDLTIVGRDIKDYYGVCRKTKDK